MHTLPAKVEHPEVEIRDDTALIALRGVFKANRKAVLIVHLSKQANYS